MQKHCCNNLYFLYYFFIPFFWLQFRTSPKVGNTTSAHPWKFSPLILAQLPSFSELPEPFLEFIKKFNASPSLKKKGVHLMLDLSCNRFLLKKAKMLDPFFVVMLFLFCFFILILFFALHLNIMTSYYKT